MLFYEKPGCFEKDTGLGSRADQEKPIGVDTLGLILKLGEPQLMLLLRELESEGKITIMP